MNDNLKTLLHYVVPNVVPFIPSLFVASTAKNVCESILDQEIVSFYVSALVLCVVFRYFGNYIEAKLDAYTGYGQEDAQSPLVEPMTTGLVAEV